MRKKQVESIIHSREKLMKKEPATTGQEFSRKDLEKNRGYSQITKSGVVYDGELAGPGGMSFILLKEPNTTDQMIEDAIKELRSDRDVVGLIKITEVIPFESDQEPVAREKSRA